MQQLQHVRVATCIAPRPFQRGHRLFILPTLQLQLGLGKLHRNTGIRPRLLRHTQVLAHFVRLAQLKAGAGSDEIVEQRNLAVFGTANQLAPRTLPVALDKVDQPAVGEPGRAARLALAQPTGDGALAGKQLAQQADRRVQQHCE